MSAYFGTFREIPLSHLRPGGWLRAWLERQRDGLTGHLEVAGYPFNTGGWRLNRIRARKGYGRRWWPYEQYAYWVDGLTRCGFLLRDPFLIKKARRQLDHVLSRPDRDGYLGPACLKSVSDEEKLERWPHAVFFRAAMALYSATGNKTILRRLTRHYLSDTSDQSFGRNVCNVETLCWLYGQTGDRRLLKLALKWFSDYQRHHPKADTALRTLLSRKHPTDHGVNYCEIAKLGAILYLATGRRHFLRAAENAFRKLKRHHVLISGVPSSSEHLRGIDSLAGHETCDIADYTWSLGYLLLATGRAEYADQIERACFNAAPGAVTPDFKALQYFSCPNQVIADRHSNHLRHGFGWGHLCYRPNPATECCPGNVNRIMPNYAARMWMRAGPDHLAATLYGPCEISAAIGSLVSPVTIREETRYPFSDEIEFHVRCAKPARFSLSLRIPGWCRRASLEINGKRLKRKLKAETFARLRRTFQNGDCITLRLPMAVRITRWPRAARGVGIERGPLVYALPIRARRRVDRSDGRAAPDFPAWLLTPNGPWSYALAVNGTAKSLRRLEVLHKEMSADPWTDKESPLALRVPAIRLSGWRLRQRKTLRVHRHGKIVTLRGRFRMTPPLPGPARLKKRSGRKEMITLVPYGRTQLRISVFPRIAS